MARLIGTTADDYISIIPRHDSRTPTGVTIHEL